MFFYMLRASRACESQHRAMGKLRERHCSRRDYIGIRNRACPSGQIPFYSLPYTSMDEVFQRHPGLSDPLTIFLSNDKQAFPGLSQTQADRFLADLAESIDKPAEKRTLDVFTETQSSCPRRRCLRLLGAILNIYLEKSGSVFPAPKAINDYCCHHRWNRSDEAMN